MSDWLNRLVRGEILVCDGGLGTSIQARGLATGDCPERLILDRPDDLVAIHRAFYDAGSDIVETNTFGGTRARLGGHGLGDKVAEINRRAAELARQACPTGRYVAGSVGPTGEMLQPFGPLDPEAAFEMFAEQVEALAEGGVDLLIVETMMAIEEAEIALRAARERTSIPAIATMTFQSGATGLRTMWGVSVAQAAEKLAAAGAVAIGANCGCGFDTMLQFVRELRPLTMLPIVAQANAGQPVIIDGKTTYAETAESVAPLVDAMLEAGVNLIGGCCGTTPDHIRMIRAAVDRRQAAAR